MFNQHAHGGFDQPMLDFRTFLAAGATWAASGRIVSHGRRPWQKIDGSKINNLVSFIHSAIGEVNRHDRSSSLAAFGPALLFASALRRALRLRPID
jgi:hypothetical protein